MNIFVTGATGYIGSTISEKLIERDHSVTGLARSDEAAYELEQAGITAYRGNLADASSLTEAVHGADAVIHAAASREPDAMRWERESVMAMLDAMTGSDKPFVYTSGASVVGDTGNQTFDETYPTQEDNIRAQIERLVLSYGERGVRPIVIRPAFVYGRGSGILPRYVSHADESDIAGYVLPGDNAWSFVHVDDLAALYVLALEQASAGATYNGAASEPITMREVSQMIADQTGSELVGWTPQEAASVIGGIAYLLPINLRVSGQKAMRELGWEPSAETISEEIQNILAAQK